MTIIRWSLLGLLVLLAGCTHTVSGEYVAQGPQFSELLQITQGPDGQLLGTLNHTALKPNGTLEQFTLNISGTTDGQSITLIGKANEPFAIPTNMSGTVNSNGITVMQPGGTEQFVRSSVQAYQTNMRQLGAVGNAIQQRIADQQKNAQEQQQVVDAENARQAALKEANLRVESLADALNNYAAMIQTNHDLAPFHGAHKNTLAAMRRDLEIEQTFPKGSVQRVQLDTRINQLNIQLTQFNIPWEQNLDLGHTHLNQLDAAIAKSPCHTGQDQLSSCGQQLEAEKNYQAAKTILLGELGDVEASLKQDTEEMNRITKEADADE